jgi:hypothetical protein
MPPGGENRRRWLSGVDKSDVTKNTVAAFLQSADRDNKPSPLKTPQTSLMAVASALKEFSFNTRAPSAL